jgi:glycolate oxidase FAD binding subunit
VNQHPEIPRLLDQIRSAIGASPEAARPLVIRGGNSKAFYGAACEGEVLDTRALAGIVSYEPSELVITAWAGTPLAEIEAALAKEGQHLAFEPPRFSAESTLGGVIAAGLSGPARAAGGTTGGAARDFVLGAQFINGKAELLTFGGQVMKNVAGYDLSRVLCGSLGTLGVITQLSIKVLPTAPAEQTWVVAGEQAPTHAALQRWIGQALPINASAWLSAGEAALGLNGAGLIVRLRGARAAVEAAGAQLKAPGVSAATRADDAASHAFWTSLRDHTHPALCPAAGEECDQELWRASVAATAAPFLPQHDQLVTWFGAERWFKWAPDQAGAVRQAAKLARGTATLFRATKSMNVLGYGPKSVKNDDPGQFERRCEPRCEPRFERPSDALLQLHEQTQRAFDPQRIFNRGRMAFFATPVVL